MFIHTKEKYGTIRYDIYPSWTSLHSIIYPSYVYNQFPDWLMKFDDKFIRPILSSRYVYKFTEFIVFNYFKWLVKRAVKRWPHVKDEILADLGEELRNEIKGI